VVYVQLARVQREVYLSVTDETSAVLAIEKALFKVFALLGI
jgi:hypothetical protein